LSAFDGSGVFHHPEAAWKKTFGLRMLLIVA
jgi:hypothetical protein